MTLLFDNTQPMTKRPTKPELVIPATITTHQIASQFQQFAYVTTRQKTGDWYLNPGEYGKWDKMMDCGKSYMVGDIPMSRYLKTHTSPLSGWQKLAYAFCLQNPTLILEIETKTHDWRVYQRGEYVEFALPHQSRGGERHYVSRNGTSKVLVNED